MLRADAATDERIRSSEPLLPLSRLSPAFCRIHKSIRCWRKNVGWQAEVSAMAFWQDANGPR
jgi:hypothetical protein